ncbi:MAG: 30S ribosomal protein S11 [Alphaproteobacteria bacterium]|nr:30S ribosomal protein S11 [Alphaproteobacteria bacterium]MBL0718187.1 30S ribosomal protein S11 [Alphaproteobacteria bacterium]
MIDNKKKKKNLRKVSVGIAHVTTTFNNTKVTVTDLAGNVICASSSGTAGFKNSKKSTSFAGGLAGEQCGKKAVELGLTHIDVKVKGPGMGRDNAIKSLAASGLIVGTMVDTSAIPHNGCKPKKKRRV